MIYGETGYSLGFGLELVTIDVGNCPLSPCQSRDVADEDKTIFSQLPRKFRIATLPQDLKWFQHVCAEDNLLAQPGTL
jgi:hypothetical protein